MFTYDFGGNILTKKGYAYTTGTVGAIQRSYTYVYGDANWKDKLTAINGDKITSDAIGNPLSDGTWTYKWAKGRQLRSMNKTGTSIAYTYNEDGLRVGKNVNGTVTNYVLHGKNVVHLTRGNDSLHFYYGADGHPTVVEYNGVSYSYAYNLQGDVISLQDADGWTQVQYAYDAWGHPIGKTGAMANTLGTLNPFRYRGYIYDEETGLYYLRSRYYNPSWGRFINADTFNIPAQFPKSLDNKNLYSYCNNNPVDQVDSSGHFPGLLGGMIIGAFFGALIGGAVSAVTQYIDEGEIDWNVVKVNAASGAISGAIGATGIGLGASVLVNAALGGANYVAEQAVKGEEVTWDGVAVNVAAGAISGFVGGSGADTKELDKVWKTAGKRIIREGRRANRKYAAKQIARYTAVRIGVKKAVAVSMGRFTAGTAGSSYFKYKLGY